MAKKFFAEIREQSQVKTIIVSKYFEAWANIVLPTAQKRSGGRIGYVDLFSGPGKYEDGSPSTPLIILDRAIQSDKLRSSLVTYFNDHEEAYIDSLRENVSQLEGVDLLEHQPKYSCLPIDDQTSEMFEKMSLIPTFFFVDPFGYKGLSSRLVTTVIRDWACECVFFFNFNRINMGVNNDIVKPHMSSLFGDILLNDLRAKLQRKTTPEVREAAVVDAISTALQHNNQNRFVLPFRFRDERGTRTSHHLIHVTKHFKGYEVMKEIMSKASSDNADGFGSFEYTPASEDDLFLKSYNMRREDLKLALSKNFYGSSLSVAEIYMRHSIGTPFTRKNHKDALKEMNEEGSVTFSRLSGKQIRNGTLPDDVIVTFKDNLDAR